MMLHYIAQRLNEAFLIKKLFLAFTDFEWRHVYAEDINNMLRDLCRLVDGNVIPMGIPWETSQWDGTAHICISHETQK